MQLKQSLALWGSEVLKEHSGPLAGSRFASSGRTVPKRCRFAARRKLAVQQFGNSFAQQFGNSLPEQFPNSLPNSFETRRPTVRKLAAEQFETRCRTVPKLPRQQARARASARCSRQLAARRCLCHPLLPLNDLRQATAAPGASDALGKGTEKKRRGSPLLTKLWFASYYS